MSDEPQRLVVPPRAGVRVEEAAGRGGMFLGAANFDKTTIPADPTQRVLRVPIPPDATGRPVYDRGQLWPHVREVLKVEHEEKVRANLIERDHLLTLCHGDQVARRDVEMLCARDPIFWINHFVWVIDPRLGQKATKDPFVLYETQEREARFFVEEFLEADEMLWLVEKSRAWGATWLFAAALATWGFLYRENWSVLLGAPNQPDVDKGGREADHNSIFGKIRFLLKNLPPWQVPDGLLQDVRYNKNYLLKHPERDNSLHGRQFCDNWGRSLRYLWTFADEAAHSQHFRGASINYGNTSNRNIALSTHKGGATEFARMVNEIREDPSHGRRLSTLHWPENPTLDIEIYWAWRKAYGWEKVAQERDIDQFGSVGFAVFQDFDPSIAVVTKRDEVKGVDGAVLVEAREEMDYDPKYPLGLLVDPGGGPDPFALIWWQPARDVKEIRFVDFLQYSDRPGPYFVPFLLGYIPETTLDGRPFGELYEYQEAEREIIERHGKWGPLEQDWSLGDCYGASRQASMASGLTLYQTWGRYGAVCPRGIKISNKEEAIQRVVSGLGRVRIAGRLLRQRTQNRDQPTLPECLKGYSWTVRDSPNGLPLARVPRHDKFCHACDAISFLFQKEYPDDPRAEQLAPPVLRDHRRKGRIGYLRTAASVVLQPDSKEDDDPITRG